MSVQGSWQQTAMVPQRPCPFRAREREGHPPSIRNGLLCLRGHQVRGHRPILYPSTGISKHSTAGVRTWSTVGVDGIKMVSTQKNGQASTTTSLHPPTPNHTNPARHINHLFMPNNSNTHISKRDYTLNSNTPHLHVTALQDGARPVSASCKMNVASALQ